MPNNSYGTGQIRAITVKIYFKRNPTALAYKYLGERVIIGGKSYVIPLSLNNARHLPEEFLRSF